jgi:hypothetical protein
MPTKRTPINRPLRTKITPAAREAFRKMQRLERQCTCTGDDDDCPACAESKEHNRVLFQDLRLRAWEWPVYTRPDDAEPYDRDDQSVADAGGPVARYHMLKKASRDR